MDSRINKCSLRNNHSQNMYYMTRDIEEKLRAVALLAFFFDIFLSPALLALVYRSRERAAR